jgi:hypothetical protein
MANKKTQPKIDEQFVAYALQKNISKLDGTETHFIFFRSHLWTHSANLTKYEFDSIFEKVCIKKEEPKETTISIQINWQIINAIKGQTK